MTTKISRLDSALSEIMDSYANTIDQDERVKKLSIVHSAHRALTAEIEAAAAKEEAAFRLSAAAQDHRRTCDEMRSKIEGIAKSLSWGPADPTRSYLVTAMGVAYEEMKSSLSLLLLAEEEEES
jgi:hypothetical protein